MTTASETKVKLTNGAVKRLGKRRTVGGKELKIILESRKQEFTDGNVHSILIDGNKFDVWICDDTFIVQ